MLLITMVNLLSPSHFVKQREQKEAKMCLSLTLMLHFHSPPTENSLQPKLHGNWFLLKILNRFLTSVFFHFGPSRVDVVQ